MLTKRQLEAFEFIRERTNEAGVPPSYAEIQQAAGLKSTSGVHRLITALEDRGYIRRMPNRARSIKIIRETGNRMSARTATSERRIRKDDTPLNSSHQFMELLRTRPTGSISDEDFRAWIEGPVRAFLPFERFLAGYGEIAMQEIKITKRITCRYEPELVNQLTPTFDLNAPNSCLHWLKTRAPVVIDPQDPPTFASANELRLIQEFNLGNVAGHGVFDPMALVGTYVVCSGVPSSTEYPLRHALELLAPAIHAAFMQTLNASADSEPPLRAVASRRH